MSSGFLQNTAPSSQRALFFTLVLGAIAVVIYMFCIQPSEVSLQRAKNELSALQDQQRSTERDLRGAKELEGRLNKIKEARQPYLDALLTPLLESYSMRAKSILDPLAVESGVKTLEYVELPIRALPLPKPAAPQLYARCPIRVTCQGSYAGIVSFVLRVEKVLPHVALEAFSLKVQTDPEKQQAEIVFEWPVKGVNTTPVPAGGARK